MKIQEQITETHANVQVAGSSVLAAATWITELGPIIQVVATFGAVVVAIIAGWYKIEQIRDIRQRRRERQDASVD